MGAELSTSIFPVILPRANLEQAAHLNMRLVFRFSGDTSEERERSGILVSLTRCTSSFSPVFFFCHPLGLAGWQLTVPPHTTPLSEAFECSTNARTCRMMGRCDDEDNANATQVRHSQSFSSYCPTSALSRTTKWARKRWKVQGPYLAPFVTTLVTHRNNVYTRLEGY